MPMASIVFTSYCAENTIYGHNYIFLVMKIVAHNSYKYKYYTEYKQSNRLL